MEKSYFSVTVVILSMFILMTPSDESFALKLLVVILGCLASPIIDIFELGLKRKESSFQKEKQISTEESPKGDVIF